MRSLYSIKIIKLKARPEINIVRSRRADTRKRSIAILHKQCQRSTVMFCILNNHKNYLEFII